MTLEQFLAKYGTKTASMIIKQLAVLAIINNGDARNQVARELAADLEAMLTEEKSNEAD